MTRVEVVEALCDLGELVVGVSMGQLRQEGHAQVQVGLRQRLS